MKHLHYYSISFPRSKIQIHGDGTYGALPCRPVWLSSQVADVIYNTRLYRLTPVRTHTYIVRDLYKCGMFIIEEYSPININSATINVSDHLDCKLTCIVQILSSQLLNHFSSPHFLHLPVSPPPPPLPSQLRLHSMFSPTSPSPL